MIALIAAISRNNVIGRGGKIPWHIPEDLKRFKSLTTGHVLVMGRKTYESIGKPLPGRTTIVISHSPGYYGIPELMTSSEGGLKASPSFARAMVFAALFAPKDIFICGGAEVYREALERDVVDKLYLTQVDIECEGDTFMPPIDWSRWGDGFRAERLASGDHVPYSFVSYERQR